MPRTARAPVESRPMTGFDKYVARRMKNPDFALLSQDLAAKIDATDKLVQALDSVGIAKGTSKAELARRISAKPEVVRRLFTARSPSPTMSTITPSRKRSDST